MDLNKVVAGLRGSRADLEDVEAVRALGGVKGTLPSTLAAFANADGGTLIVGLDEQDGFKAAGVTGAKSVRNSIIGIGRDKLAPSPVMSVEIVPFEDASLVVADVEPLPPSQRPCYVKAKGLYAGAYVRVGGEDQKLTSYEIDRMKENAGQPRWDSDPVPEAGAGDLDRDACARLIETAKRRSPRAFGYTGETDALVTLGVLVRREGTLVPTLAGLLSVGRYPQQFFPQLMVTVAVHPQDTRGTGQAGRARFLDSATLTGAIPAMVTDAVEMVRQHLKTVGRVVGSGWEDRPEIEPEIVWEALANALMHRDYSPQARGSQVQVDLFPTRLEVSSPGGLFGNVRPGNLGASGTSSSRNSRLAALLQETIDPVTGFSVAENRGGGIAMMINRAREATGVVPLLDVDVDRFRVVIPRSSPVTAGFLTSMGRRRAMSKLSESQTTALALAYWGYDVDVPVLCRMGLSPSAARVELADLVAHGLLRPGRARGDGPYRLNIELKPAGALRGRPGKSREVARAAQEAQHRDEFPLPPGESPEKGPVPQLLQSRRPEPRGLEPGQKPAGQKPAGQKPAGQKPAGPKPGGQKPPPRLLEAKIPEDQSPEEQIMTALHDLGEASRRDLQKATGLSRGQLTDFLQELLDAGLVASTGAALGPNRRYRAVPPKAEGKASRTS